MKEKLNIFGTRLLQFVFHPFMVMCYAAIVVMECNVFPFAFVDPLIKMLLIYAFLLMLFIFPMLFIILFNRQNFIKSYSNLSARDMNLVLLTVSFLCSITHWLLSTIEAPAVISMIPTLAMANIIGISIANQKVKINTYTLALSALMTYFIFVSAKYHSNMLIAIETTILAIGTINYVFIEQEISTLKLSLLSSALGIAATGISIFFIM